MGGDFNALLSSTNRWQGNPVTNAEVVDFQQCLQDTELMEIRAVGDAYTWTNNQEWTDHICSNIDRCFANGKWFSEFSHVIVERLERGVSDHCPQLLKFEHTMPRKGMFRFYNVIADHEQFQQVVRSNWRAQSSDCLLRDIWRKCNQLKGPLKELNTTWFLKTTERVEGIRQKLKDV